MDILLTVVLGYIDSEKRGALRTTVFSEVFKYDGARMRVNKAISARVEEIRQETTYPNVISVSHSIIS